MDNPGDETVQDSDVLNQDSATAPPGGRGGPETWSLDALPPELDYFRSSAAYQVELTGFQGPLDLLLYLIDRDQVDIYDIPIARITDQFIRHIEVMQSISLDQAGEFIAMAATLLVIKMKMLMPSRVDEEEEAEEDPRAELVRRLLEYKRFKEAALALQEREDTRRQYHTRQLRFPFTSDLSVEPALRVEMFDLLAALAGIYDRVRKRPVHDIVREPFTVDEKIQLIVTRTADGALVRFEELFAGDSIKMEVVVTFIAILEMVKRGRLVFVQTEPLGPIWLQRPKPGAATVEATDDGRMAGDLGAVVRAASGDDDEPEEEDVDDGDDDWDDEEEDEDDDIEWDDDGDEDDDDIDEDDEFDGGDEDEGAEVDAGEADDGSGDDDDTNDGEDDVKDDDDLDAEFEEDLDDDFDDDDDDDDDDIDWDDDDDDDEED